MSSGYPTFSQGRGAPARPVISPPEEALGEHRDEDPLDRETGDRLDSRHDAQGAIRRERRREDAPVEGRDAQDERSWLPSPSITSCGVDDGYAARR